MASLNSTMTEVVKPNNFSWVDKNRLAGLARPRSVGHLNYLERAGIGHLVTLANDMLPPISDPKFRGKLKWTLIPVKEFQPPSVRQILQFISICEQAHQENYAVGVHCRQGLGRTGVMLACYLVRFAGMSPEMAVNQIRRMRPYSVETYEQERIVVAYNDHLRRHAAE